MNFTSTGIDLYMGGGVLHKYWYIPLYGGEDFTSTGIYLYMGEYIGVRTSQVLVETSTWGWGKWISQYIYMENMVIWTSIQQIECV